MTSAAVGLPRDFPFVAKGSGVDLGLLDQGDLVSGLITGGIIRGLFGGQTLQVETGMFEEPPNLG